MVACISSMHSKSPDCVLGVARFISSASTILAKIGPGTNSNSDFLTLKKLTPVMSDGKRSGVNWMRLYWQLTDAASDLISTVFPVPGTSSSRTWPPQSKETSSISTVSDFPTITFPIFSFILVYTCVIWPEICVDMCFPFPHAYSIVRIVSPKIPA